MIRSTYQKVSDIEIIAEIQQKITSKKPETQP